MVEAAERREWWKYAIVTVPAIVLAGSASGWLSNSGFGNSWFDGLIKPFFMPPGWAFGVVWPILYCFLALRLLWFWPSRPRPSGERADPVLPPAGAQFRLVADFLCRASDTARAGRDRRNGRLRRAYCRAIPANPAARWSADGPVPALALLRLRAQFGHRQSQSGRGRLAAGSRRSPNFPHGLVIRDIRDAFEEGVGHETVSCGWFAFPRDGDAARRADGQPAGSGGRTAGIARSDAGI